MKIIYASIFMLVLLCTTVQAQKRTFLRLCSLAGNKFNKGYFAGTTDSSINIYKNGNTIEIPASNIGFIKTKRSVGHNFLISELAAAIPFTIMGAAFGKANDITIAGSSFFGFMLGSLIGLPSGAIITGFKQSTTFAINGNLNSWRLQRKRIDLLPIR